MEPENTGAESKSARTDEQRAADRERQRKSRANKRAAVDAKGWEYNSTDIPKRAEAIEILKQRIEDDHVAEVCYEQALVFADRFSLPANRFLFAHGVQQTLKSYEAGRDMPLTELPKTEPSKWIGKSTAEILKFLGPDTCKRFGLTKPVAAPDGSPS
jgi:hypothetical protein